jgi:hypothetical protein
MKKLPTIIFVIILSVPGFSQGAKFGVYISPQIAWLSPEAKDVKSGGTIGKFAGGLIVDNYFAKNYAFSTGIAIGGQGGKLSYNSTSNNALNIYDTTYSLNGKTVKYNLQYINVPLGLKLRSNEIGYLRFHVIIGFTNQFNIKAKVTDETDGDFNDDSIKDAINFYNLGYHFGGGVDYALGEDTSIFLTIVYDNGFIDVTKSDPKVSSRVLSLRLGITF